MNNKLACDMKSNIPFGVILTPNDKCHAINDIFTPALIDLVRENFLVFLRGFNSGFDDPEKLTEYANSWGNIMEWPFGQILDVREHLDAKDHIFDSSYVPLHWDGMYKPTIPEFQIFHCVAAPTPEEGGRTSFVNTVSLLENIDKKRLKEWSDISITYRINKVVHYGGELCSPLVIRHPISHRLIMRYNEPPIEGKRFLNPHALEVHGIADENKAEFHQMLNRYLYDSNNYYAHQWQKGDIVIADNFSLLHGREAFTARSARHLQRVHIQAKPEYINTCLKSDKN